MANKYQGSALVKAIISLFVCAMFVQTAPVFSQIRATEADRDFAQATQLHESGDLEGAIRGYRAILASHPNRADVRSNLGAAYPRLGGWAERRVGNGCGSGR